MRFAFLLLLLLLLLGLAHAVTTFHDPASVEDQLKLIEDFYSNTQNQEIRGGDDCRYQWANGWIFDPIGRKTGGRTILGGEEEMIKSPNYPNQYPSPFDCTWIVPPRPGYTTRLEVEVFETDPQNDWLKLEERITDNNTEYLMPLAYLKGSLTSEGLHFETNSVNSSFQIQFQATTVNKEHYRFHISTLRDPVTPSLCENSLIFLNLTKPFQNAIIEFVDNPKMHCSKMIIAPEDKSIELKRLGEKSSQEFVILWKSEGTGGYVANDVYIVDYTKEMPDCAKNGLTNQGYRSFTNKIVVKQCYGTLKLLASLKYSHCLGHLVSNVEIRDPHLTTHTFGTPEFDLEHYEFCEKLNYSANIESKLRPNATHFPVFSLSYKIKPLYPTTFELKIPSFDQNARKALLSFNSSKSGTMSFLASNFIGRATKGALEIKIETHFLPLVLRWTPRQKMPVYHWPFPSFHFKTSDCKRFNNGLPIFDVEGDHVTIPFKLPIHCAPMDFWMRVKNRSGKILTVSTSSSTPTKFDDRIRFTLLFDGKIERSFIDWESFSTEDFKKELKTVEYIYIHLETLKENHQGLEETKALNETEFEINFQFEWNNECHCGNQEIVLNDDIKVLTSPNFPGNYCNDLRCHYNITAPEGAKIRVEVKALQLASDHDILIFEQGNSKEKKTARLGHNSVEVSDVNQVTIHFLTDHADVKRGFVLQLTAYYEKPQKPHFLILFIVFVAIIITVALVGIWIKLRRTPRQSNRVFMRLKNEEDSERLQDEEGHPLEDFQEQDDL